jgi:DNA helicase-2/ATP-dependent DNA helicase PcrA
VAEAFELDSSQRRVAEAPTDARTIVIAGAGQGKTEVVAARLRYLVGDEDLSPIDEVLVLSFSRAAVGAARARLAGDRSIARVMVRTFDSLASRLLLEAGEEVRERSFDARVRSATRLLQDPDADLPTLESLRHVIVDEVQDLVGDRAELVLALLGRLDPDTGFTVLGDPLQAIFDFTLRGSTSTMTSDEFLGRLRRVLGASDDRLENDYRAQTSEAKAVVALGERMRAAKGPRQQLNKVEWHVSNLPSVGDLADLPLLLERWPGRTAVLCETNGQALMVSRRLFEFGVNHRLRRPAEQLSVPAWVAVVLGGSLRQHVDRRAFDELVDAADVDVPEDAWRLLKATERRRQVPRELDIVSLADRIAAGDVPVDLADPGDADVVVSTVHRAKGLEFENVVLVLPPRERDDTDEEAAGERARELYVALSRTRRRVVTAESPKMRGVWLDTRAGHRWVRSYKNWQTNGFEFQLTDVERERPFGRDPVTAQKVQELLREELASPGLPVEGRLISAPDDVAMPVYELSVDGTPAASTSANFGTALTRRLHRAWRNNPTPPARLELLRSDGVETAAGPPRMGAHVGVGRWGLWLAPRIGGLARLSYERGEQ